MKKTIAILLMMLTIASGAAAPRRAKKKSRKTAKTTKVALPEPRTSGSFVTRVDEPEAPKGLDGKNIALWQSHGRYYDAKENRWMWQRARLLGTVEDLFPQSFVIPYLIPMLENAGAYVMTPRERDTSKTEIIVDGDGGLAQKGYSEKNGSKKWEQSTQAGFGHKKEILRQGDNPFRAGSARVAATVDNPSKTSTAVWTADIPETGEYALYVSYLSLPESARDARYTVTSMRGTEVFEVNQTMGGGTWVYLGTFPFARGKDRVVELSNLSSENGKVVSADAVRIGGGMGNIARGYGEECETSGYPRFTEGARYWLQWAGMPGSVYSQSGGTDDYDDDLRSRGNWVNYISGGSRSNPAQGGLGIPVDLAFAFHTDAGTTSDGYTTIGTLPIVSTAGRLGNGKPKTTASAYATIVTDQVISDIRALYDPSWTRRKMRNKPYVEAREPVVPTMLLELLSHQNFADMRLGLDPNFRFDVSRAIYKGILRYMHETEGTPYVVAPLPVSDFSISGSHGQYTLTWSQTPDPLEPTATPRYYIVYERINDGAFTELAVVDEPRLNISANDNHIYSYRVVAANDGGRSFPSETLALCDLSGAASPQVLVVNGFTRVSGPAEVYRDGHVGFDYAEDHGVPYIRDILFTGEQTEFRPEAQWINNDAPGHGASRATHETEVIAGNTFDFVYIHGEAIRAAGHPFISSDADAFISSQTSPVIIDLILGKQKEILVGGTSATRYKTFTAAMQQRLTELAECGTAIMASGSYIGSDLFDNRYSMPSVAQADREFARKVLGIAWRQSKATATGQVREVRSRYPQFRGRLNLSFNQTLSSDCYAVESPESFAEANPAEGAPILRYTENGSVAGTAFAGPTHRSVAMGFPFETITGKDTRNALMQSILNFLTDKPNPTASNMPGRITVYPGSFLANEEDALSPRGTWNDNENVAVRDPAELTPEQRPRRRGRARRS